jgi:hypothetical protein
LSLFLKIAFRAEDLDVPDKKRSTSIAANRPGEFISDPTPILVVNRTDETSSVPYLIEQRFHNHRKVYGIRIAQLDLFLANEVPCVLYGIESARRLKYLVLDLMCAASPDERAD